MLRDSKGPIPDGSGFSVIFAKWPNIFVSLTLGLRASELTSCCLQDLVNYRTRLIANFCPCLSMSTHPFLEAATAKPTLLITCNVPVSRRTLSEGILGYLPERGGSGRERT